MSTERNAANALTAHLRVADLGIDARRPLTNSQIRTVTGWLLRPEKVEAFPLQNGGFGWRAIASSNSNDEIMIS